MDHDELKDARAVAASLSDQALAALTEPERVVRLFALSHGVKRMHDELSEAFGSREQAAVVLMGSIAAVIIGNVAPDAD